MTLGMWQHRKTNLLAFRGGDSGKLLLDGMDQADKNKLRELGYLSHWEEE